jgi:hypothetical protein
MASHFVSLNRGQNGSMSVEVRRAVARVVMKPGASNP